VQVIVVKRLQAFAAKTVNDFDDVLVAIFAKLKPPFYFLVALFLAVHQLKLSSLVGLTVKAAFVVIIVFEVIRALGQLTDYFLEKRFSSMSGEGLEVEQAKTAAHAIRLFVQIALWGVGLVAVLDNLGVNVTTLVTSLGIGGIAIALAVQNVLGDVLSSFTIFSDKPFRIGDLVQAGADLGHVEKIGLKSTRVRTVGGELLVIPNREMASVRVRNFRDMPRRRVLLNFGITYGLPSDKLKRVKEIVQNAVAAAGATFDRCHFKNYGDSALQFEAAYYVENNDGAAFLNAQEKVNFEVYDAFAREGITFAYPTMTVDVRKNV